MRSNPAAYRQVSNGAVEGNPCIFFAKFLLFTILFWILILFGKVKRNYCIVSVCVCSRYHV